MRAINKCVIRKASCITLLLVGLTVLIYNVHLNQSPLLGLGLMALGASWLMKSKQAAIVATLMPVSFGVESLLGTLTGWALVPGINLCAAVGLIWLSCLRYIEK